MNKCHLQAGPTPSTCVKYSEIVGISPIIASHYPLLFTIIQPLKPLVGWLTACLLLIAIIPYKKNL